MNSSYHSVKSPTFGYGERTKYVGRFKTPGPGTYRCPSDFGYVDVVPKNNRERDDINNYGPNFNDSIMSSKHSASK